MKAGDAFRLHNRQIDDHLWIVVSDPSVHPDRVVIVSVTTHTPSKDQGCILEAGDHPSLGRRSCIA